MKLYLFYWNGEDDKKNFGATKIVASIFGNLISITTTFNFGELGNKRTKIMMKR